MGHVAASFNWMPGVIQHFKKWISASDAETMFGIPEKDLLTLERECRLEISIQAGAKVYHRKTLEHVLFEMPVEAVQWES